jgi:alpha-D-ribose 1-methylphosphonate 5-triphosphate synthase subunit PhnH
VTGAKVSEPARARFALAFAESAEMTDLSVGSHWSPEFGALLCQRVTGLGDTTAPSDQPALRLRLTGPGVKVSADLTVTGLTPRFVELRASVTADFPAGVDVLLVTDDGDIAGLPRTTRIEVR